MKKKPKPTPRSAKPAPGHPWRQRVESASVWRDKRLPSFRFRVGPRSPGSIPPAERSSALKHLQPMTDAEERDLYATDRAAWAERAQHTWRVLLVKSSAERRKELLALAPEELRELLHAWLRQYAQLHQTDRRAWAAFVAPTWRIVLTCADPEPKRELWARMDPELKAALKALAEQPELEKAA